MKRRHLHSSVFFFIRTLQGLLPLSRPIPFIPPARSQRQRHRHICPVVGGGCDGGCCCIKDSVEMLFFHHQFYYFLQIYFSFRLLFSNFTCC